MRKFSLTATIWDEEGVYVSKCPELGVASCGDTPEEALSNLKEAVELYLDNARELGIIEDVTTTLAASHKFTSASEVAA
ncbi:type II toxin-antitoxin system HicB family antitoxin [Methanosarcinales archaeon]|nr:MAG: type II toxin-antitoxin system HicB family antitoxin [Methanosarcinales archaeon]